MWGKSPGPEFDLYLLYLDVIGVCKSRGDLATIITKKDGKELRKRDIVLVDRTNTEIPLTLWGKQAEDFEDDTNPVVAVKGAKVGDFQGKNLSLLNSSVMMVNPEIPESHQLRGWYDNEGMNIETKSLQGPGRGGGGGMYHLFSRIFIYLYNI